MTFVNDLIFSLSFRHPCVGAIRVAVSTGHDNRRITKQRTCGEHWFAQLTQMDGKHLHTIGLARARVVISLKMGAFGAAASAKSSPPNAGESPKGDAEQLERAEHRSPTPLIR